MNKIFIIGLIILSVGIFIFGIKEYTDFKKEKKELNNRIDSLKKVDDSLINVGAEKQKEYDKLEQSFQSDSLVLVELKDKYYDAKVVAQQTEKQAEYYKVRYSNMKNKINYLETHTINITMDSLLISLSKKIN
jgi:predicted nuclease with TOPRIM domain